LLREIGVSLDRDVISNRYSSTAAWAGFTDAKSAICPSIRALQTQAAPRKLTNFVSFGPACIALGVCRRKAWSRLAGLDEIFFMTVLR
jgi:hypothetical protein